MTKAVADKNANILIVSTYSKDYIMIKSEESQMASDVLKELGMKETVE